MELSIFVAKITSVIYLSAGLGAIFSADHYRRLVDDMFNNAALTYLMGFTAVILGFLIVNYHNIWAKDWTVLITIIGWLGLVKGALIIAFPRFAQSYSRLIFQGRGLRIFPYLAIFIGLLFGYFGFVS
ncbi:MAG: hypothetical protein HYV04_00270 [Deltaproteobacteria bacterium]|nr:hypothetical protein [Deltaproteobacteria bacterium]